MTPTWLLLDAVLALHKEQIDEHGGRHGIKDLGALESALTRPQQLMHYGTPDIADLAASLAFGIVRNHPFVDGNKRVSFLATVTFLNLNGHGIPIEHYRNIWDDLADKKLSESDLADWLRQQIVQWP